MWVGNKTSDGAENRERLDFEMGGGGFDRGLVERDVRVVLFVYVQVFDQPFFEKVVKGYNATFEELNKEMNLRLEEGVKDNVR